jgi:hypothetical protein
MQPNNIHPQPAPIDPMLPTPPSQDFSSSHQVITETVRTTPFIESSSKLEAVASDLPVAVVKVLSVRGVEYGMMTIALWIGASTLAWIALNMLNGSKGFSYVVVPTSALVVCVPIFGLLFMRLKRAELANPSLRLDPSKRRWSQITQMLAYLACLINLIFFVYTVLQHFSADKPKPITKALINLVVILVIAGGILRYYWVDEHRSRKA